MILKKCTSIFMAVVLLFTICSIGITGYAAGFQYDEQYLMLKEAMLNDYVRELTNYVISNETLQDDNAGFNKESKGFVYEHMITAKDNAQGDILKAANRFYVIFEHLYSTEYGTGLYEPKRMVNQISSALQKLITSSGETYYEDFYGKRYYPTTEEIDAYQQAVEAITASEREVSQASLTQMQIFFIQKDIFEFYNIETVLKYFLANCIDINAGNWYHRFVFTVETSVSTCLENCGGLDNLSESVLNIRKAVYQISYQRTTDETGTKFYYSFAKPDLSETFSNYHTQLGLNSQIADLTATLTSGGQAEAFVINSTEDTTTIPYLTTVYNAFVTTTNAPMDANGATWDAKFTTMTEAELADSSKTGLNAPQLMGYIDDITDTYSNKAIMAVFGESVGNMITLDYILKPISQMPSRTVRGTAKYNVTGQSMNQIVRQFDALIYDDGGSEENAQIASRVATILKQFFNTTSSLFEGTSVEGLDFENLNELVRHLITGVLFTDNIINTLVNLAYPLVVGILADDVIPLLGSRFEGTVSSLLDTILKKNELAVYPETLAKRIVSDGKGDTYATAVAVLKAGGTDWESVNFEALTWGVDDASYEDKPEAFSNALCTALGGFMRLVVTVFAGDAEYAPSSYGSDQYSKYWDKKLLSIGSLTGYLRAQGGYTKLIVPLFRVLGLSEMSGRYTGTITGYLSSQEYNRLIDGGNYDYSLSMIVKPLVYWVTDILGKKPFETLWALIPNLVYFFIRNPEKFMTTDQINANHDQMDKWANHSSINASSHTNFALIQTYNLLSILDNINITIDLDAWTWSDLVDVGSLRKLLDMDDMLGSVNGLINEVLSLEFDTEDVIGQKVIAYADGDGNVLPKNTLEYTEHQDTYTTPLYAYYTNEDETVFRADDSDPECQVYMEGEYEYRSFPYKIPALQEEKLTSVTTANDIGELADPNAIGIRNTEWNTIDVKNPGIVLLYILRFVMSALGYKYDATIQDETESTFIDDEEYITYTSRRVPMLIACFGLDMEQELFQGLTLGDIIYNIMLHPDDAICALLELFYPNETGDYYTRRSYTYALKDIDYHNNVLLNTNINPTLTYGPEVVYSKYWTREYAQDTIADITTLATNVLPLIGLEGFENGFGPFLANFANEAVFNNDMMDTVFNLIYPLLSDLNGMLGFDVESILDAALGIKFDPLTIGNTITQIIGADTPAAEFIKNTEKWSDIFPAEEDEEETENNEEEAPPEAPIEEPTEEPTEEPGEEPGEEPAEEPEEDTSIHLDWGINNAADYGLTAHDAFLRNAAALLSPAAFLIKFLFMDKDLDILGLIRINSYAGYQYSMIALWEALSCPNILTYNQYYEKSTMQVEGTLIGDANSIYYLLSPILGLVDKLYVDPLTTILNMIPNLLFFISIGGLNDLLNNLIHFAYVLLDILKPIVNAYDLLGGLLANIEVAGLQLNLSIPLDIDFNGLVSSLLSSLLGDSLEIEGVKITLPYFDLQTLCVGTLTSFLSKELRTTVRLNTAGGGDLLTQLLRVVFSALFMPENEKAVSDILYKVIKNATEKQEEDDTGEGDEGEGEGTETPVEPDEPEEVLTEEELLKKKQAIAYNQQTMFLVVGKLFDLMEQYQLPDLLMYVVYLLVSKLTPISDTLADTLGSSGTTIPQLLDSVDFSDPQSLLTKLITFVQEKTGGSGGGIISDITGGDSETEDSNIEKPIPATKSLWERIKDFFKKLKYFLENLFMPND